MTEKKEKVVVEECKVTYFCDVCGAETKRPRQCVVCGKEHVCENCRVRYEVTWTDCETDYPRHSCKRCWDIGKPFLKEYHELEEKHDQELDKIIEQWKEAVKLT